MLYCGSVVLCNLLVPEDTLVLGTWVLGYFVTGGERGDVTSGRSRIIPPTTPLANLLDMLYGLPDWCA